jgi:hypothetical protein
LHLATLPNSLSSSSSFLMKSLGLSVSIISSVIRDNLLPSLEGLCFFLLLISLATTSCIMLNKNAESRCPCLVPDLQGKALNFSPLSM